MTGVGFRKFLLINGTRSSRESVKLRSQKKFGWIVHAESFRGRASGDLDFALDKLFSRDLVEKF